MKKIQLSVLITPKNKQQKAPVLAGGIRKYQRRKTKMVPVFGLAPSNTAEKHKNAHIFQDNPACL